MFHIPTLVLAGAVLIAAYAPAAHADNPMGYHLLSAQDAQQLPQHHGVLGLRIERAQQISDQGLTFDIIRVADAPSGSPGARAGLRRGDQIIAVDGQVFSSLAAFAGYVGSIPPGGQIQVDYMPSGGGPQQAQRVSVALGGPGAAQHDQHAATGMSTSTKLAIGAGAIALFGCYEMGCFSHHQATRAPTSPAAGMAPPPQ